MKLRQLVTSILTMTVLGNVQAEDQTNYVFENGSVIIHCAAPTQDEQISTDVFNEAFPLWITKLQVHANEGRIARAHFLSELKQGIFIVVVGEDRDAAMAQALEIQAENQTIMQGALDKAEVDVSNFDFDSGCRLIEIGPVAILPFQ